MPMIDEYIIDEKLWERVKAGDMAARKQVQDDLQGMFLYEHCLAGVPGITVTLRELADLNMIESVCVEVGLYRQ